MDTRVADEREQDRDRVVPVRVAFNRDCLDAIIAVLDSARESIDVCVFAIADDRLKGVLFDALRRRVRVRVMTESDTAGNSGADAQELQAAGIEVRFEATPALMHHKFIVVDRRFVLTGSMNWTRKALEFNHENVVILDDPPAAEAFLDEFHRLWTMRGTTGHPPPGGHRHREIDEPMPRVPIRRRDDR